MSHDSNAAAPAARALPHVPEARAHDIAVPHRPGLERERGHAADADAPPAAAASSGARVSQRGRGWLRMCGTQCMMGRGINVRACVFFPFSSPAAASPFTRPRRGSTPTPPTAPLIPKSSQVSSNKNQVGRHLSPLPRLLYLTCSHRPHPPLFLFLNLSHR